MGVYVFRCLCGPFIKVGHHLVTRGRPHAYYRIAGRGFESVIHPEELDGHLYMEHLCLEAWYPQLTRHEETMIHRSYSEGRIGEFHRLEDMAPILQTLDGLGSRAIVSESARMRAVRWGKRQVRKAKRRRTKNA